jgi:hypothetical protein
MRPNSAHRVSAATAAPAQRTAEQHGDDGAVREA